MTAQKYAVTESTTFQIDEVELRGMFGLDPEWRLTAARHLPDAGEDHPATVSIRFECSLRK